MNNITVYAWLNDLQMSSRLAKICTTHSYNLEFVDNCKLIQSDFENDILVIQLNGLNEVELAEVKFIKERAQFTIIGYGENMDNTMVKYFKESGCDIVLRRTDLIKNLGSLLEKIANGG